MSVKEEEEGRIRDEDRFAVSCMTGQQYKAEGEGKGEKEADQMERSLIEDKTVEEGITLVNFITT